MSKFTVAGVSTQNGITKVRFANDIVSRTKLLAKGGHSPLELVELPKAMTKAEACQYLLDLGGKFSSYKALITETMGKKNGVVPAKAPKAVKPAKTSKAKPTKVIAPKVQEEDLEITEIKDLAA
jgi:hypothetical protein